MQSITVKTATGGITYYVELDGIARRAWEGGEHAGPNALDDACAEAREILRRAPQASCELITPGGSMRGARAFE